MEAFGGCLLLLVCLLFLVAGFFLLSMSAGVVTTVIFRKHKRLAWLSATCTAAAAIVLGLLVGAVYFVGSFFVVPDRSPSDDAIKPYLLALDEVDRAALGFTPISPNSRIGLEYARGMAYDVMLHVYAETSRTIAFKKTGGTYQWVGEQEIFKGPRDYRTADGILKEEIIVTYDKVPISGVPPGETWITYMGDDPRLTGRFGLTLQQVQPILEEWKRAYAAPTRNSH